MTLRFGKTADGRDIVHIQTAEDMYDLRDNHPEFTEGAMAIWTMQPGAKTPPRGFINHENPKMFGGIQFLPGAKITHDAAGNFGILTDDSNVVWNESEINA